MSNYPATSLGSGLIGIGREWGINKSQIPSESEVGYFLKGAINLGIRFFDTAPAYGASEERLGKFLQSLETEMRKTIFVATKCGEFWKGDGTTYIDHSFDVLKASVDNSLELLGDIQLIQIHKSSVEVLSSDDFKKLSKYIKSLNIPFLGASISDIDTGLFAASVPEIDYIQLPYNQNNHDFLPVIQEAQGRGKKIIVNRPFGMGKLVPSGASEGDDNALVALFRDIILSARPDIILTGTKTAEHLEKNQIAFNNVFHS